MTARRWLVRLLVLAMVPVLMVAGSMRPAAAVRYGDVASATVGNISRTLGWECKVSAYFVAPTDVTAYIKGQSWCKTGQLENDVYIGAITFEGASCVYYSDLPNYNIDEGGWGAADEDGFEYFTFTAIQTEPATVPSCGGITEVCLEYYEENAFGGEDWDWKCVGIDLGSPPFDEYEEDPGPDADGCESITSGKPGVRFIGEPEFRTQTTGVGTGAVTQEVFVQVVEYRVPAGATGVWKAGLWTTTTPANGTLDTWQVHPGEASTGQATAKSGPLGSRSLSLVPAVSNTSLAADGEWHRYVHRVSSNATATGGANPPDPTIVGIEGAQIWTTGATGGTISIYNGQTATTPTEPGSLSSNVGGLTWADICTWYWGTPITTGDKSVPVDPDVPVGGEEPPDEEEPPLEQPPDDDDLPPDDDDPDVPPGDDACGDFSLFNPATWASGGICVLIQAVVKLIDLFGKMLSILADILRFFVGFFDALLDLLLSLFVPDGDALAAHIDGLSGLFDESPAGGWTDALSSGLSGSPSGGCAGPTFSPPAIAGADLPEMTPFDACGDNASAASIVRTVISLSVALSGGFLILRMILTSLGIRTAAPPIGGKES